MLNILLCIAHCAVLNYHQENKHFFTIRTVYFEPMNLTVLTVYPRVCVARLRQQLAEFVAQGLRLAPM